MERDNNDDVFFEKHEEILTEIIQEKKYDDLENFFRTMRTIRAITAVIHAMINERDDTIIEIMSRCLGGTRFDDLVKYMYHLRIGRGVTEYNEVMGDMFSLRIKSDLVKKIFDLTHDIHYSYFLNLIYESQNYVSYEAIMLLMNTLTHVNPVLLELLVSQLERYNNKTDLFKAVCLQAVLTNNVDVVKACLAYDPGFFILPKYDLIAGEYLSDTYFGKNQKFTNISTLYQLAEMRGCLEIVGVLLEHFGKEALLNPVGRHFDINAIMKAGHQNVANYYLDRLFTEN